MASPPVLSQPPPPDASHISPLWPCIALYAVLDFLVPPMIEGMSRDGAVVAGFLAGLAAGQAGPLTVWAVFGPERLTARWIKTLAATAFLYGTFLAGIAVSQPGPGWEADVCSTILMAPLVFTVAQVPLWLLRIVTGWEIVPAGACERPPSASRQFGLKHMLGAITAAAAVLALASVAFSIIDARGRGAVAEMWLAVGIACAVAAFWNGLLTIPSLYAVMAARDKPTGCLVLAGYVVTVSLIVLMVIAAIAGNGPLGEVFVTFLSFHAAAVLAIVGSLHFLGVCGYVLHRPRATVAHGETLGSETASSDPLAESPDANPSGNPFRET